MSLVRRILGSIFLASLTAVCANATITPVAPSVDGDGCYLIGSAAELYGFSAITNGTMTAVEGAASPYCVKLTDDITVNTGVLNASLSLNTGSSYEPWIPLQNFAGTIDGQGHVISGLYVSSRTQDYVGFVGGRNNDEMEFKNLGIVDSYFEGRDYVGAFAGEVTMGNLTFLNCFSRSAVVGRYYVGGFVGVKKGSFLTIKNSYMAGYVKGSQSSYTGAFVGDEPWNTVKVENAFYRQGTAGNVVYGTSATVEEFGDGTVVEKIFSEKGGSIWRQGENDVYPNFKGDVVKGVDICYYHYGENDVDLFNCTRKELPSPKRANYFFGGWYETADFSGDALTEVPQNISAGDTLFAKWNSVAAPAKVDNCYQIANDADLYGFAAVVNGSLPNGNPAEPSACGKLTADIVVNGGVLDAGWNFVGDAADLIPWIPIGKDSLHPFSGTFDGDKHTISGLYADDKTTGFMGLFGVVAGVDTVRIKNVGVKDAFLHTMDAVGGLVGYAQEGALLLTNVFAVGNFCGGTDAAGIVGRMGSNEYVLVADSYAAGSASSLVNYGGLFGSWTPSQYAVNSYFYYDMQNRSNQVVGEAVGEPVDENYFTRGIVAQLLREGENGAVWGQNVTEGEKYPDFSGVLNGAVKFYKVNILYAGGNVENLLFIEGDYQYLTHKNASLGDTVLYWSTKPDYSDAIEEGNFNPVSDTTLYAFSLGSRYNCFEMGNAVELDAFSYLVSHGKPYACGKLIDDIVYNENVLDANGNLNGDGSNFRKWMPIGSCDGNEMNAYTGNFDGQGHTISGLYFNDKNAYDVGLFGCILAIDGHVIENVGLEDVYILAEGNVGGLAGAIYPYTGMKEGLVIRNVYVKGSINANGSYVGGLIGVFNNPVINVYNSYVAGSITGAYAAKSLFAGPFGELHVSNVYYNANVSDQFGEYASTTALENGALAARLHNDEEGSIWGQNVSMGEKSPNFSGEVVGAPAMKSVVLHNGEDFDTFKYVPGFDKLPEYARDGYMFAGWTLNSDYSGKAFANVPAGLEDGSDLYLKWFEITAPKIDNADGCYEIETANELYGFAAIVNGTPYLDNGNVVSNAANPFACGKLAANITVNENVLNADGSLSANASGFVKWTPIGWYDQTMSADYPFKGSFDGQGHTISGLYYNDEEVGGVGLFGLVIADDTPVMVRRLSLVDSYLRAAGAVGGIFGSLGNEGNSITIEQIYNATSVVGVYGDIGALAGNISNEGILNVLNVYNTGLIKGSSAVGGLVGFLRGGEISIKNAYNVGPVEGLEFVGALFGLVSEANMNVQNAYYLGEKNGEYGTPATMERFADGSVAALLHNGENGSIWGQDISKNEEYPNFSGVVNGVADVPSITLHFTADSLFKISYLPGAEFKLPVRFDENSFVEGWYDNAGLSGSGINKLKSDASGDVELWAKISSANGCVMIATAAQLFDFSKRVNDGENALCGMLLDDIVLNGNVVENAENGYPGIFENWVPIGSQDVPFVGSFDGRGHTISGLYYYDYENYNVGLFGFVSAAKGDTVRIENLGIEDSYIVADGNIGGFIGSVGNKNDIDDAGVVELYNVHTDGVFGGSEVSYVGGLIGTVWGGIAVNLSNVYSTATVIGDGYVGGLIGYARYYGSVGILNSYVRGLLNANYNIGGFVGLIDEIDSLNVTNSYSAAEFQTINCGFGALVGGSYWSPVHASNFFHVANERAENCGVLTFGETVSVESFKDGSVAGLLHNYTVDENNIGSVWGQKNEENSYPELNVNLDKVAPSQTVALHSFGKTTPYTFYESISKKIPTYAQDGYLFLGWYADERYSGVPLTEFPDGVEHVYAKWFKVTKPEFVNGCYEIATAADLYGFAAIVNGTSYFDGNTVVKNDAVPNVCGKLANNIVVNRGVLNADGSLGADSARFIPWIPIGVSEDDYDYETPFAGTFDGDGHTISGLYFNDELKDFVGLFGLIYGGSATIQNVGIIDSYIKGHEYVGSLVGKIKSCSNVVIDNVYNKSTIVGYDYAAGLVGYLFGTQLKISQSYNAGEISSYNEWGDPAIGGLIGRVEDPKVTLANVYNTGSVSSYHEYSCVGGFIGYVSLFGDNSYYVKVYNTYSVGQLHGGYVGPIFGYVSTGYNTGKAIVENGFYLSTESSGYGTSTPASNFSDGTIASILHSYNTNGVDGSIWGQNLAVDAYPTFSGSVTYELVLDWDKASDTRSIPQNLPSDAIVRIADGKQFFVNGEIYEGELTGEQIAEIGTSTMYPISGVTFEQGANGLKATIDAKSDAPLVIPMDVAVGEVVLDRSFKADTYSSIVLPFSIARSSVSGGAVYEFTGIKKNDSGKWVFAVRTVQGGEMLQANHPYVVMPDASGKLVFEAPVTLNSVENAGPQISGNWQFVGAYEYKQWLEGDSEIGYAYGIAGESKPEKGIKAGDFVKVAAGASVAPTRSYLIYRKTSSSRPAAPGEVFGGIGVNPDVLEIEIVDEGGEQPLVIGTFNIRTGEIRTADDRWFDMKGRILNAKPTQKGTYFHKGKQVIIK